MANLGQPNQTWVPVRGGVPREVVDQRLERRSVTSVFQRCDLRFSVGTNAL